MSNNDLKVNFTDDKTITINSMEYEDNKKIKSFLNYLNDKDITLGIIKFFISLKQSNDLPNDPIEILKDYFSAYNDDKWSYIQEMEINIEKLIEENEELENQKIILREKLDTKLKLIQEQKLQKEQEEREELEKKIKKSKKA